MDIGHMTPMTEANRLKEIEQDAVEKQKRKRELEGKERIKEKKETRRFWINTAISAISALAAVVAAIFAGVSIFC